MTRFWSWSWTIGVCLALCGCVTKAAVEPWPCTRYAERPQVRSELIEMKRVRAAVLWVENPTTGLQRVDLLPLPDLEIHERIALLDARRAAPVLPQGLYRATREWVAAADAKCAADRALVGAEVKKDDEKLTWWERSWIGRLLRR